MATTLVPLAAALYAHEPPAPLPLTRVRTVRAPEPASRDSESPLEVAVRDHCARSA